MVASSNMNTITIALGDIRDEEMVSLRLVADSLRVEFGRRCRTERDDVHIPTRRLDGSVGLKNLRTDFNHSISASTRIQLDTQPQPSGLRSGRLLLDADLCYGFFAPFGAWIEPRQTRSRLKRR